MRVASIPAGHPYVRNSLVGVELLDDPAPPHARPGQWWPPVMWDADWIRANSSRFDLMHAHFGLESFSIEHLRAVVEALREAGRPLVFTVHDLTNPQLVDQGHHERQLDLLVLAADALVTLTPGAAAEIARRWGRIARVIPHPRIVTTSAAGRSEESVAGTVRRRVGIHLKDLRPGVDGPGTVRTAISAVQSLGANDVELEVHLQDRVRDPGAAARVCAAVAGVPFARLLEHSRYSDAELERSLSGLAAAVLPYRHGSHSGWLELCWDLGVPVLAPTVGFYLEQHDEGVLGFRRDAVTELAAAIQASLVPGEDRNEVVGRRRAFRIRQQGEISASHAAVYAEAIEAQRYRRGTVHQAPNTAL